VPDDGKGRAPRRRPGPAPTTTTIILPNQRDKHCLHCICPCRCHRPPEQSVRIVPPRPGDPFWSAHLAALSFELGDLAAAYAALEGRVAA
jgi:hypothetical protein